MRLFTLILTLLFVSSVPASAVNLERLYQGRSQAQEGRKDFAMMEFHAFLRNSSEEPYAGEAHFALAEYYYGINNPAESRKHLAAVGGRDAVMNLLASVYRLKMAEADSNAEETTRLSEELKSSLASKKTVIFSNKKRARKWTSPMGYHYQFKESVDRKEILRDGSPFYEVTLS